MPEKEILRYHLLQKKLETSFNPISHGRWSWRLPVYSNHQLSNKDRAAWQKTWWQYGFKYPAYFERISFIFHYQKVGKFWIWKCSAKNFLIFNAFFINLWSRGKHSWLWNQRSCVQIPAVPFLFLSENGGLLGIEPGVFGSKVSYAYP